MLVSQDILYTQSLVFTGHSESPPPPPDYPEPQLHSPRSPQENLAATAPSIALPTHTVAQHQHKHHAQTLPSPRGVARATSADSVTSAGTAPSVDVSLLSATTHAHSSMQTPSSAAATNVSPSMRAPSFEPPSLLVDRSESADLLMAAGPHSLQLAWTRKGTVDQDTRAAPGDRLPRSKSQSRYARAPDVLLRTVAYRHVPLRHRVRRVVCFALCRPASSNINKRASYATVVSECCRAVMHNVASIDGVHA